MSRLTALALFTLPAAVAAGCGARGGGAETALAGHASRPAIVFPSRNELTRIASAAPAAPAGDVPGPVFAEEWDLGGPFPENDATMTIDGATPIGAIAAELVASSPGATATRSLECAARELARFSLHADAFDERVARFALARCGSTADRVWVQTMRTRGQPDADEARIASVHGAALRDGARAHVQRFASQGATQIGVQVASDAQGNIAVGIVGADEYLDVAPRAPIVNGDAVDLRGRVRGTYSHVGAIATYGPHDYVDCTVAPEVVLPDVAIRCPVHASDRMAWVAVHGTVPGRILAQRIGRVLVRRDAAAHLPALEIDRSLDARSPGLVEAILARANAFRAETGRPPLALELEQSTTVQSVMPIFFSAESAGEHDVSDTISLGLIAGWDVSAGTIRDAHLAVSMTDTTPSPGEWLALLMEDPIARAVLLDPEARSAAIGAAWDPAHGAFTGLAVTYELFEGADLSSARDHVVTSLIRARAARGVTTPPTLVRDLPPLAEAAAAVQAGRAPGAALDRALRQTVDRVGRGARAWLVEGLSLDALRWPDDMVTAASLTFAANVAWYRVPGAAWGQYAVLVIVLEP
jgi:hypothetical protein